MKEEGGGRLVCGRPSGWRLRRMICSGSPNRRKLRIWTMSIVWRQRCRWPTRRRIGRGSRCLKYLRIGAPLRARRVPGPVPAAAVAAPTAPWRHLRAPSPTRTRARSSSTHPNIHS
uniref:(northern house mosquito) hypothetical protein n=1 Tax=Culex pipiens TaxID=7175 RepID=A0A8D7ZY48_CULPI